MLMKMTSLRCSVVIVLSLFAPSAQAQFDSNAMVSVYCPPIGDGCTMTVTHAWAFNDTERGSDFFSLSQSLGLGSIGPFRYRGGDSVYFDTNEYSGYLWSVHFNIDTTTKMFRNFVLSSSYSNYISPCVFNYGGYQSLSALVDSLPYKDSSGKLRANGAFLITLNFTAKVDCASSPHQGYTGYCENSEQVSDTISIEIIPNSYLDVTEARPSQENSAISIREQGSDLFVRVSDIRTDTHTLEIYDLLGRNATKVDIPSAAEFVELPTAPLPPGLYFARLGNQVAKFVVPPR
jgi:hypothetical protein